MSPLSSLGRQTTSAPYCADTAATSASSVDTMTLVTYAACRALVMVWAISGWPATSRTFLRGMPFDPPRAGITATALLTV